MTEIRLEKVEDFLFRIPKQEHPGMRVDGLIYADEKLLKDIYHDKALEQVINVAHLPGIVNASLAMPDIHWGFGFPIGGVAATDIEEGGVISPGGVGYDINCLAGDSLIMHEFGYTLPIQDFYNNWNKEKIKCYDFVKNRLEKTGIKLFLKFKPKNKVFRLKTYTGRQIVATEDHPFYTPDGMKKLANLKIGSQVAINPFVGVPYEQPINKNIIVLEDIKRTLSKIGRDSKGKSGRTIIKRLKERGLLSLNYNHQKLPYLLKIIGMVLGDGNMNFIGRKKDGIVGFSGKNKEDLERIRKDVIAINYTPSPIYKNKSELFYKGKFRKYANYSFYVNASSLVVLLNTLGVPIGQKVSQSYGIPEWIKQAPLWQKRLFLASFFGAELSTPRPKLSKKANFYAPVFYMSKREKYLKNGISFLKDISQLAKEFGVETKDLVMRRKYQTKRGDISWHFELVFSCKPESLINLWSKIGFEYNQKKVELSKCAIHYLTLKQYVLSRRLDQVESILLLKNSGLTHNEVFREINDSFIGKRYVQSVIQRQDNVFEPRIPNNFPSYKEFIKEASIGLDNYNMLWDSIEVIEEVNFVDYVYDFSVEHQHHNFIANNFVVSNCGVRLMRTNLTLKDIEGKLEDLVYVLFNTVPAGVGSKGDIRVSAREEKEILVKGSKWAVSQGYGTEDDLLNTEEQGAIAGADPDIVSQRAYERGKAQSGTLGSGNHFLEVQVIDQLFDADLCDEFGLDLGQITVMIHSGSRGFGYQVCEDYVRGMVSCLSKYNIKVPDRQLACAPVNSDEGRAYLAAMRCAANYAWANRQCLMHLTRLAFEKVFNTGWQKLGMQLIYDVAHNIAKIEKYNIDGKEKNLCVHRKGATRALGPDHPALPLKYKKTGQPVIIPGDMGRNSYLLVGTKEAEKTFYSTCFAGDTKVLTDRGIVTLKELYEFNKLGLVYNALSFNKDTFSAEWKPILGASKRMGQMIRVCISQTNRSRFSTLDTSSDHKFSLFENAELKYEEIEDIIEKQKMICVLDRIGTPIGLNHPRLAFLMGALVTDGYIDKKQKRVIFTQKETQEKLHFIDYVRQSFQSVFAHDLGNGRPKVGGGYIRGKAMIGIASDFATGRKQTAKEIIDIYDNLQTWILGLDQESILNFLAGVIDGDGTWSPRHKVIDIFNSKENVIGAIIIACLKLGILPYVSVQRENCYIIQISEKIEELLRFTKRVKGTTHNLKYGSKLFSVRQLFTDNWQSGNIKWPFTRKADRNNLMDADKISKFLSWQSSSRYNKKQIIKVINSPLRMQRARKLSDLGERELYNIDVQDNHNYFVFTKTFTPVLVKNCHGAGRVKSRTAATKTINYNTLLKELESKGIIVKASGRDTLVEEAPSAYKDINDVVKVVQMAGISKRVCRMRPLGVIKG